MASISRALRRIKEDLGPHLPEEEILAACRAHGKPWRERLLGPVQTVHLFVLQVLHLNMAISGLRHLVKFNFAESSYCAARKRLPLAALQALLVSSSKAMREAVYAKAHAGVGTKGGTKGGENVCGALWRGLRAFLVDGSSTITPDNRALAKAFGYPSGQKKGCGFPVAKLLGLFDAFTGMMVQMLTGPLFTHDMGMVSGVHELLGNGDLLVADRGLCSFGHVALLVMAEVKALFRMHQRQIVDFRPHRKARGQAGRKGKKGKRGKKAGSDRARGDKAKYEKGRPTSRFVKRLAKHDQLVWWIKPEDRPDWMTAAHYEQLPGAVMVREIRYRIPAKGQRTRCVTIATTLLDPVLYPKEAVAELYGMRWRVETHLAELKTAMGMKSVKCKTPDGVRKELAVFCLVYNLVHAVMAEAALRQGVGHDRISFTDAVRFLQHAEPGEELPDLVVNPHRPDRHEPRKVKTRNGSYPVMTQPRQKLKKQLKRQPKKAAKKDMSSAKVANATA
jgi:hypothetical protein